MQFISDRQSLAEQFAFKTQQESSYLLSSRASRRKIVYEEGLDPATEEIEDFKEEIQQKYTESIANKIYTFPFNYASLDMFDDSELTELEGDIQICLYNAEETEINKSKFKILNKKIKNQKVANILSHLKSLKQNVANLTLSCENSLCQSSQTKPTANNASMRKSKGKQPEKSGRIQVAYEALGSQEQSPNVKRHLRTEPYEKPLGYILKKK